MLRMVRKKSAFSLFFIFSVAIALTASFLPHRVFADTLIFKNYDRLTGQLVGFTTEACFYSLGTVPNPLTITWNQISSIKTTAPLILNMKDGDRLTGTLEYRTGEGLFVVSSQIGALALDISSIKNVEIPSPIKETNGDREVLEENPSTNFGKEDEEAPTTFLRGATVLLSPKEIEARISFGYAPSIQQNSLWTSQQRLFVTTLGLNVGIADGLEGWVSVPFSYISARRNGYLGAERSKKFDWNDISFGLSKVLVRENESWPEITVSAAATVPTGQGPYEYLEPYTTGSGHWRTDMGLHFVRTLDPAVIYMGANIGYTWPKHTNVGTYEYDWDYGYYLGMGFAINEKLSFMSRFDGIYQPAAKFDNDREGRFSSDLFYGTFGFSYRLNSKLVFEPQISFGLNDASDSTQLRLGFSRKF